MLPSCKQHVGILGGSQNGLVCGEGRSLCFLSLSLQETPSSGTVLLIHK
jgi:hypothetical protein